ncbi:MAG: hypothetical protein K6F41_04550 [Lachnospira sp.]|nr:hypothetical protein [Lachnospira sp.]
MEKEYEFINGKGFGRIWYKTISSTATIRGDELEVIIRDEPLFGKDKEMIEKIRLDDIEDVQIKTGFDFWDLLIAIISLVLLIPSEGKTLLLIPFFLFWSYRKDIIIACRDGSKVVIQNDSNNHEVKDFVTAVKR